MGRAEDLNPLGQTGEQPGAGPRVETLRTDSILESLGARQFVEDSTALLMELEVKNGWQQWQALRRRR